MADTKRDIAELLKTQRESLGLSIDEIFERTRIAPGFLQAFEDGNFDVLPRAYARLFLKTYARELGLDAQDILTRFEKIIATQPAPPPVQASSKHRLNFRLSSLLLIACVLIMAAIIILNLRQKTELTAPLDTAPPQPPVAQPPAEIQPTLQDSAQQPDDPTSVPLDTLQITLPESEANGVAAPSENQEMPSPAQSDTGQPTPSESEADTAVANQEMPSPAQSDTGQPSPSESEADTASQPANQETPSPAQSDTLQITLPESEANGVAPPSENQEMPSPAQSDTGQPSPSESETTAASRSENREAPSPGREPGGSGPPAPDVLTTYNLPLPVIIADGDRMILSCVATENTSLSITADGRALFEGVLPAGSAHRWRASDHFQIYVQRAGAISLSLQDAPIESASPPDRSLRLNISRTFIRVEEVEERQ